MIRNNWTLQELDNLYNLPLLDLIFEAASVHRQFHDPRKIQLSKLISIKTGGCIENCKYCSQSSSYNSPVTPTSLIKIEEVISIAKEAKKKGLTRICLGAAWREIKDGKQFDQILEMVSSIDKMGLEVCCTLGMLNKDQAKRLKDAGLYAYNHNLDTSSKYYAQIITSRTYLDRLDTLKTVKNENISLCCGGIIGLGEKLEDRLELIKTLASFDPHPDSVPINRLIPIKGTPLEDKKELSVFEFIKTIAVSRIAMPKSIIRLSAGRENLTYLEQSICFLAGASSIFIGDKLLTAPNKKVSSDEELLKLLKLIPHKADHLKKRDKNEFLKKSLGKRVQQKGLRSLPKTRNEFIDLTSNDYLGLAKSLEMEKAISSEYQNHIEVKENVLGSTGSRLLTGNREYIETLEESIAKLHNAESALIFNSGYMANIGLLSCVADENSVIILDSESHASTWQGANLSKAKTLLFRHNDLNHLDSQLKKACKYSKQIFICIESIYSMTGDFAPLKEIATLTEKYNANLIVDEAHSTGVVGENGEGLVHSLGLENQIFARVHTFGKALATHGAAILGNKLLNSFLINFSKPFIYTTSLPFHSYVSISIAYKMLEKTSHSRLRIQELINYYSSKIKELNLLIKPSKSHIQPVYVGDPEKVEQLSYILRKAQVDIRAIKSPTVRKGKESLRLVLHAFNTKIEIDKFFNFIKKRKELKHV